MEFFPASLRGSSSSTQVIPSVVLAVLGLATARALYYLFFHPLNRYPGPKLWAVSRAFHVWYNFTGRLPFKVLELHRKYGPVVRIAPDELSFTDAAAWDDIYGLRPGRAQNAKDKFVYTPLMPGYEESIIHADDATHRRIRRIYAHAFTPKALDEQAGMLQKYANLMVTQLKVAVKGNAIQDMSAWYNFTTFDLTGEFAFGEAFHCLDCGGEYHFFVKTVFDGVVSGLRMMMLEHYGILTLMKPFIPESAFKPKEDMDKYTRELVDRRVERGYIPGTADVSIYLLQNKDAGDQLSKAAMYENGVTLVVAGSETTGTLLTGTTYFLCKHPETLRKVQDEVRSAFKSDSEITYKSVNDLTYMIAALSETMRIFPPTGFGFPRHISAKEGQTVAGHYVPHKTRCAIFHWAAYHDERNFARPEAFVPERWLPDTPNEFKNDRREVVQPFMVGPRACLGKNLAYAEMRLLLAKMLWHFDFELADSEDDWLSGLKAFMVWDKGILKVRLKPVEG